MVKQSTVRGWGFNECLGIELKEGGDVAAIFCKTCREFYSTGSTPHYTGAARENAMTYVKGTDVIKKVNFANHISKNDAHRIAVLRLAEKKRPVADAAEPLLAPNLNPPNPGPRQSLLKPMLQRMTTMQRDQLRKKFQLAHYIASSGKSFKSYAEFASFEKNCHGVDIGSGYLTSKAGTEISKYIAISQRVKNITQPLNNQSIKYYSILFDGSSSAKCVDEKELYVIKVCDNGVSKFNVMSLEEPDEVNAQGLKNALENSIKKMDFNFERKNHEIGMCSDSAAVNKALYNLVKPEIGDHYLCILCPSHKFELAINDAFQPSNINTKTEKDYTDIYYFFKKSPLRWRLLKRQAIFEAATLKRYKRLSGTRWVEHRIAAIESELNNLPIFVGFCDQQIAQPHNTTIKKLVDTIKGLRKSITTQNVIFKAVKLDVLNIIKPLSKVMQEIELLSPTFITTTETTISNLKHLKNLIKEGSVDVFEKNNNIFPKTASILSILTNELEDLLPERSTRHDTALNPQNQQTLMYGYLLSGGIKSALNNVKVEIIAILDRLSICLANRFDYFLEDPFFTASATFLETFTYKNHDCEHYFEAINNIETKFYSILCANGCDTMKLKTEFNIMFNYIKRFLPNISANKAWQQLFQMKESLGISNILHLAEICIAMPISNAECERVFSFLWRVLTKQRTSLSHETLERLLQLRNSKNKMSDTDYDCAIDMFLSVFPDGTVRSRKRHIDGHSYPENRKSSKTLITGSSSTVDTLSVVQIEELLKPKNIEDIDIQNITDDDWSSSSDEN